MEFSFGACDDNCGACDRSLSLQLASLSPLFLARWIVVRNTFDIGLQLLLFDKLIKVPTGMWRGGGHEASLVGLSVKMSFLGTPVA